MSGDDPGRIFRFEVPVDKQVHTFELHGDPLAVGCRDADEVEFWAVHYTDAPGVSRSFTVVGTGRPLPATLKSYGRWHWGTAASPSGLWVWHLVEVQP